SFDLNVLRFAGVVTFTGLPKSSPLRTVVEDLKQAGDWSVVDNSSVANNSESPAAGHAEVVAANFFANNLGVQFLGAKTVYYLRFGLLPRTRTPTLLNLALQALRADGLTFRTIVADAGINRYSLVPSPTTYTGNNVDTGLDASLTIVNRPPVANSDTY